MRECLSCKRPIPESRRKNAVYCERPACRAREYRRRQREAEQVRASAPGSATPVHIEPESLVITCSCGNRLRIQVSQLGHAAPTHVTTAVAVPSPLGPEKDEGIEGPETCAAAAASNTVAKEPAGASAVASTPTREVSTDSVNFRTCELFGTLHGRVVALSELPTRPSLGGGAELSRGAELCATMRASRGFGLAGTPGRWREFYPHQRPTEFGLDADLAVLVWDPKARCGKVADADQLRSLWGRRWRERLRELSD